MEIVYNGNQDSRLYKAVIGETIDALMKEDEKVVWLDADLRGCSGTAGKEGDRYINCGIAEANMIGIAAGLSASGPTHTPLVLSLPEDPMTRHFWQQATQATQ